MDFGKGVPWTVGGLGFGGIEIGRIAILRWDAVKTLLFFPAVSSMFPTNRTK